MLRRQRRNSRLHPSYLAGQAPRTGACRLQASTCMQGKLLLTCDPLQERNRVQHGLAWSAGAHWRVTMLRLAMLRTIHSGSSSLVPLAISSSSAPGSSARPSPAPVLQRNVADSNSQTWPSLLEHSPTVVLSVRAPCKPFQQEKRTSKL